MSKATASQAAAQSIAKIPWMVIPAQDTNMLAVMFTSASQALCGKGQKGQESERGVDKSPCNSCMGDILLGVMHGREGMIIHAYSEPVIERFKTR